HPENRRTAIWLPCRAPFWHDRAAGGAISGGRERHLRRAAHAERTGRVRAPDDRKRAMPRSTTVSPTGSVCRSRPRSRARRCATFSNSAQLFRSKHKRPTTKETERQPSAAGALSLYLRGGIRDKSARFFACGGKTDQL